MVGTNFFNSLASAVSYYAPYGIDENGVAEKLNNHEIRIGKPDLPASEIRLNSEGRWVRINE